MTSRIRTQKKIYTPTTNTPEAECYLCEIIETKEYVIVHRSSIKRIYGDTAEIMVSGRRTEAKIEHRGSREECRRIWHEKEEAQKISNFDHSNDYEIDDENQCDEEPTDVMTYCSNSKNLTKSSTPKSKRPSFQSTKANNRSSTMPLAKRRKHDNFEKEIQVACYDMSSDDEQELSIIEHLNIQLDVIRQENQKHFDALSKKIDKKNSILDADISNFREPGNNQPQDDIAKNIGDYARNVMRVLYTQKELIDSILPPGASHYVRKPLDNERFEKLHKALRCKYNIIASRYDEFFYKLIRPKLVDFLIDERKRANKNNPIDSP
ncbi:unnamed protein product [Rotaria magnacalcarata]|uniref:Uncharacterized protein n=1 Tax=Rotaria magnacalcarata TaxID=392030 RepID=A0A817AWP7_9BILA|nr:unnamed protein product [Rotaria magnacalcarata]